MKRGQVLNSGLKRQVPNLRLETWHLKLERVHYSDQLSNFRIIPDYLKVVDFIEEMEAL